MEFIEKIKRYIYRTFVSFYGIDPRKRILYNINLDVCKRQKRLAFVYLNTLFDAPFDKNVFHVSRIHIYQLLLPFFRDGYVIDIYPAEYLKPVDFLEIKYDMIFGFGPSYLELIKRNPQAKKIIFITENAPWVVRERFNERLQLYKDRNGRYPEHALKRMNFYNDEMFELSDIGIAINGTSNIGFMKQRLKKVYQLDVNALYDECGPINKIHKNIKQKFLWFGSTGAIHKGLDILVDAFRYLPDFQLDVYGASLEEIKDIKLPRNVKIRSKVNVYSDRFIEEVVKQHTFVVSLSCSEGMQSSIATCMMYGLIPIVSKETGYDDNPFVKTINTLDIPLIIDELKRCVSVDDDELSNYESQVMEYAKKHYTIDSFTNRYFSIIDKILTYDV